MSETEGKRLLKAPCESGPALMFQIKIAKNSPVTADENGYIISPNT